MSTAAATMAPTDDPSPAAATTAGGATAESAAALKASAVQLVAVVGLATGLAIGTAAAGIALVDRPDLYRPLLGAAVVTALASALSLVPLVWGLRRGLMHAVAGYFVSMGVRLAVSLGGGCLAVFAGNYPVKPTLLLMACMYLVVLAVEAAWVGRVTWTAGGAAGSGGRGANRS
ncbi:MAG TPA: hypothetical protein VF796_21725 [Humisphaera sp.]